jgi:hypothetical protein
MIRTRLAPAGQYESMTNRSTPGGMARAIALASVPNDR